jgi:hypothetical protein
MIYGIIGLQDFGRRSETSFLPNFPNKTTSVARVYTHKLTSLHHCYGTLGDAHGTA